MRGNCRPRRTPDVDLAELLARFVEGRFHCRVIANIQRAGCRGAPGGTDCCSSYVQFLLFAACYRDAGAMLGKALRHALADAASAACHECVFPLEQVIAEDAGHRTKCIIFVVA